MISVFQEWEIIKEELPNKSEEKCTYSSITPRRIGLQIQESRIQKRYTVNALAEIVGVPPRMIAMFENGTETPDANLCASLEKILNISFPVK